VKHGTILYVKKGTMMIEIRNLTKRYGSFTAIDNVSCNIAEGGITGLVGYNGAGKTTLLKTICGVYRPEKGEVTMDGQAVFNNEAAKGRLFFVPDDPYVLPQASMKRMAKFYRGYYPGWDEGLFLQLAEIFKLDINKRIGGFSKGMQRQAFIIFALCVSSDYILIDEIFDGLDPTVRDLVRQLLLEAIAGREAGVIISSHNLRELEDLCNRICIINDRHIIYDADIDDMRASKNKYRAAFAEAVDGQALLEGLGIKARQVKNEGNVLTFLADGLAEEIKRKLLAKSPLLLESFPLTLEEIFITEMGARNYDFSGLFDNSRPRLKSNIKNGKGKNK
jgi:ABC-2 type transport system ATP-binding protein